jgi:hypothetical protein
MAASLPADLGNSRFAAGDRAAAAQGADLDLPRPEGSHLTMRKKHG